MEFYVSTTAFRRQPMESVLALAERESFALEFSSGLPFRQEMEEIYRTATVKRLPHNYFPAPREPFVLNLASPDEGIRQRSVSHCLNGLRLAHVSGSPFFSVHAGFCMDPDPKELGRQIVAVAKRPRQAYWDSFMASLRELVAEARKLGVRFLVENNVLAPFNLLADGTSPFLCVDAPELLGMIKEVNAPELGILIDTGHLKVSARTLGFSEVEVLNQIRPHVSAFHHSDNDGLSDSNLPFDESYWFLTQVSNFRNAAHILEVHDQNPADIRRQFALLEQGAHVSADR